MVLGVGAVIGPEAEESHAGSSVMRPGRVSDLGVALNLCLLLGVEMCLNRGQVLSREMIMAGVDAVKVTTVHGEIKMILVRF